MVGVGVDTVVSTVQELSRASSGGSSVSLSGITIVCVLDVTGGRRDGKDEGRDDDVVGKEYLLRPPTPENRIPGERGLPPLASGANERYDGISGSVGKCIADGRMMD